MKIWVKTSKRWGFHEWFHKFSVCISPVTRYKSSWLSSSCQTCCSIAWVTVSNTEVILCLSSSWFVTSEKKNLCVCRGEYGGRLKIELPKFFCNTLYMSINYKQAICIHTHTHTYEGELKSSYGNVISVAVDFLDQWDQITAIPIKKLSGLEWNLCWKINLI